MPHRSGPTADPRRKSLHAQRGQTKLFKGNLVVIATPGFIQSAIRTNFIRNSQRFPQTLRLFVYVCVLLAGAAFSAVRLTAQATNFPPEPRVLVTQAVDDFQRAVLHGNTHPQVRFATDQGGAPASLPMQRMILVLNRSAEQESTLRTLLDEQQTKGSPNYHQWLTPEQFGKNFGPADSDMNTVEAWLESHGFKVDSVSKGRTTIEFSGTAGQVQDAFQTEIHSYLINGESHWANATDPSIPSALAPVVRGVMSLHNFPRHAQFTLLGRQGAPSGPGQPLFTFTAGKTTYYGLGPTDFATIYNVLPLWSAGIDGTGQTIAIVGETDIHISDIEAFRSLFGLSAKDPQIIVNGPDPGISEGDEPEAVLDVSWSGAVAKNATIDLVSSATTNASLGVDLSALYIVDNNLAPVMSESYGECEATLGAAGNAFYNSLWQQAAAQGITVVIAAGDAGSAGCDNFDRQATAIDGLAVSGFASTPYDVAVGGTDFDQTATTAPTYWSAQNNSSTGVSALGYIPETTWNQSCAGLGVNQGASQCAFSSSDLNIVAGSGGRSQCYYLTSEGTCLAGNLKPSWQTGPGVPPDGVRDLPDVSLFASPGFNGSFYIICEADVNLFGIVQSGFNEPCSLTNQTFLGIGGTSAAAPSFAAIMALVNQKTGARQGNANYVLYNLAAQPGASCNSSSAPATGSSCVFYDVTKGNNSVPCTGTLDCAMAPGNGSSGYGVMVDPSAPTIPAWTATEGYDLATGLGTVNADNLAKAWNAAAFAPSTTTIASLSPVNLVHGQPANLNVTVSSESGSGTPSGSVALMAAPGGTAVGVTDFPLVNGTAIGSTTLLPGGAYNVIAHYPGDGTFAASDSAPVQVTVSKENSQTTPVLEGIVVTANSDWAPVTSFTYGSILQLQGNVTGTSRKSCAPSPQMSSVSCPGGSVTFMLNSKPVNAGTYALNSLGYAVDLLPATAFTSLGSYTLQAQYSGDSSYNSSSGTLAGTVSQAPTFNGAGSSDVDHSYIFNPDGTETITNYVFSGQLFHISGYASSTSILQAPTGTISLFENGNALSGTPTMTSTNGSYSGVFALNAFTYAALSAALPVTIDAPGTYNFTSSYSGDTYYAASQSSTTPFTLVVEDSTFNITPPIPNVTIAAPGQSGTTTVTLADVDNFPGQVVITCTVPAAMAASCPPVTANVFGNPTTPVQLTISTTGPQTTASAGHGRTRLCSLGALACVFFFGFAGRRRKTLMLLIVVLSYVSVFACGGCGHGSGSTEPSGTPPGTYTVNVTATSLNITRTGSFTVTIE